MIRMTHELRLFFIALQFLTRAPVPRWVGFESDWLNQSARYFPAVGLCIGGIGAMVLWTGSALFPPSVAVGLSMLATVLLTGAFHEDGLADTCDALGGAVSRTRALEIMKDSRIGTYGAAGLVLILGLKAAALVALTALPLSLAMAALLLAHTVSRTGAVLLIRFLPYAGDLAHAKAKPLAQRISATGAWVSLAWPVGLALGLTLWNPGYAAAVAWALLTAAVGTGICGWRWHARLGGYTGDTLGATQQISELLALLGWLAALRLS